MLEELDYSGIPEHMESGVRLWIEEGIATGCFLVAFLENDLREAFIRADDINRHRMADLVAFFYYQAPAACWGSKEKVKEWRERGGLKGMRARILIRGAERDAGQEG